MKSQEEVYNYVRAVMNRVSYDEMNHEEGINEIRLWGVEHNVAPEDIQQACVDLYEEIVEKEQNGLRP